MRNMLHIRFVHGQQQRARPHNKFYFNRQSQYSVKPEVDLQKHCYYQPS